MTISTSLSFALVLISLATATSSFQIDKRQSGSWTLVQNGTSAVSAMQFAIVSPTLAIVIDKVESNAAQFNGHPAWGSLFNMQTNKATTINVISNSFCAGGSFISNGTFVSFGGNGVVDPQFGDLDGFTALRLFAPCTNPTGVGCTLNEWPNLKMAKPRWYPTAVRIFDGSALIIGGTWAGGFYNTAGANEASYEFFPKKDGGAIRNSAFLARTIPANLFPLAFALPDGRVFIAANNQTIIYNIQANTETSLPPIPNGVRVTYPFTASGALLPLSPPSYTPEVLICGGTTISDSTAPTAISAQTPASNQCARMVLTTAGIAAGWKVEHMLEARMMPETVLLPNGQILIVNGCKTGVAGYGNVQNRTGQSNCDNPAFKPSIYTPTAPAGSRFSNTGMPTSSIPRLYHSVASVTPMGNIIITGSNPNVDVTTVKYATEYRVEYLNPPYMFVARPSIVTAPAKLAFGAQFALTVSIPSNLLTGTPTIQLALMDLGFTTHAIHTQGRLVFLTTSLAVNHTTMTVQGPPNGMIYPPGPGWLYLTVNGVTSQGKQVIVGSGGNPPVPFN